jgi:hypothetical protein
MFMKVGEVLKVQQQAARRTQITLLNMPSQTEALAEVVITKLIR